LQEGDLVKVRGTSAFAKAIRAAIGSFTNHDAIVARLGGKDTGAIGINEAVPPRSRWTSLEEYEDDMNAEKDPIIVRIYRLKGASKDERKATAHYFSRKLLGLKYPRKVRMVLLASKIANLFADTTKWIPPLRLNWCSQLVARSMQAILHDSLDGLHGKKKKLFTPKTFENRILMGLFEDVTDECIEEV